ncbi:hypothetical protein GIB67_023145, partial [Kingdonia uniflora]
SLTNPSNHRRRLAKDITTTTQTKYITQNKKIESAQSTMSNSLSCHPQSKSQAHFD